MPRPPRIRYPGAIYHITARGNDRRPIFRDDGDRHAFLRIVGRVVERYGVHVDAYCLMGNHFHLLVETPNANIGDAMRDLNSAYCQYFNRTEPRGGHLLERRYGGQLLTTEAHLMEVVRYIALNPVRAGLVEDPADWEWSSHRAHVGVAPGPTWLSIDRVLARFRRATVDLAAEARSYADFVEAARLAGLLDDVPLVV